VVGRVMRPEEGKKALVVDYVDVKIPVLRRSAAARTEMFARWEQDGQYAVNFKEKKM